MTALRRPAELGLWRTRRARRKLMVDEASVSGKDGEALQDLRWGRCGRPSGPSLPFVAQIIQDVDVIRRLGSA